MSCNDNPGLPQVCELNGKLFRSFPDILFRKSETEDEPVMVFTLGDKQAALPLQRIGREFNIVPESHDARMIETIITSLDFINGLRIGERFPAEVVNGTASWKPDREFRAMADARLQMRLVAWLTPEHEQVHATGSTLLALMEDPVIRAQAQEAMSRAARLLGLETRDEVFARVQELADELSYIEHLRARFLERLEALMIRLGRLSVNLHVGSSGFETMTQVRKLLGFAHRKIGSRFEDIDSRSADVPASLQNLDELRRFIRAGRNFLYRSYRGFEPHIVKFEELPEGFEDAMGPALSALYQFLAPRFMPVTEWLRTQRHETKARFKAMTW